MHHRLLLGSTALVGAGMLFTSAASAQETGGIQVVLGGFTEFGVTAATDDTLDNQRRNQNYSFYMDNEVILTATGVTDGGVRYGSKVEIEVGGGGDAGSPDGISIDEVGLFFSGNFGRVELGRDDGAEDLMFVGAEDVQAGTGGIDGDTANLGQIQFPDMGDDIKATYFTPRVAGFQLGASFTPDGDDNTDGLGSTALDGGDGRKNAIGGGLNWVGVLGPVDLTLSAVGNWADVKGSDGEQDAQGFRDDAKAWAVGGILGFGGLGFGVSFNDFKGPSDLQEGTLLSAGLSYGFGPANVSVGYEHDWNDNLDNTNIFVVSGDIGLMPGVTLKGDVSYNTDDPFKHVDDDGNPTDSGSTLAGVATIQLDY
ncbi:MAG TPA: porin [Geminicoccaceae bacterium]|nr:porin [Geminicoccaceae bacterium]